MKRITMVIAGLLALGALLFCSYRLGARNGVRATLEPAASTAQRPVLYWYDPMKPDQHFDKPGKSPFMDMDLVPKYADDGAASGAVRIDPAVVQNLGVRTQVVRVEKLARVLSVPATVAWDPRESYAVNARVDAVIEQLSVRAPFTQVSKGEVLAALLAPQWSAAAGEYFALAAAQSAQGRALRAAARERLRVLGMSEADIAALRPGQTRVLVRAPADGIVAEISVREGERIAAGAPMLRINGADHVWLEAAVPQAEMAGIAAGTPVSATFAALPAETFDANIEHVLPDVDTATRTQRVRIVLDNAQHTFAPGMFAHVRIESVAGLAHPLIPDAALIATGDDTRVALAQGDGRFRIARVRTGASANGMTEILEGLSGGERIVVSGQFLIDSEASLSGALERLQAPDAAAHEAHAMHGDHAMPENHAAHGDHAGHAMPADHSAHDAHAEHQP